MQVKGSKQLKRADSTVRDNVFFLHPSRKEDSPAFEMLHQQLQERSVADDVPTRWYVYLPRPPLLLRLLPAWAYVLGLISVAVTFALSLHAGLDLVAQPAFGLAFVLLLREWGCVVWRADETEEAS